ncbi:phosphoglycerate dehydrogenase [Campylobacter coli]|uniref:Phosphoglycerate dehydrogenase n=3 Tax=Campylobacter coli TaxID=195 RepID=A0A5Y8V2C6_CAMCO|nr:phosphoglycerate dehydrogenase [Campylobacter coli]ECQ7391540.1 phosphoglycerate dehydrogenase [Campylobacter jejuni]ALU98898.1 D-3-phosphoglycerate dehydrogenase [Campylobacter coli]EAC1339497.1 3-phosphoglycerate dehydrogenase [Campylobacter coli]EAH4457799.1 3-phosphoglycerate dehydrogenase [Campylobacter coli]EAH4592384.1 3-phosphoglycerate dehydrogenase [Campylobacter coli]
MKVFISTHPFGETSKIPLELLDKNGFEVRINNRGRKITSKELSKDIGEAEVLIAGTEKITEDVLRNAPNLKLISRVGIGLDGIDFELCRKYNIKVVYTPDAPTMAVAELCVGLILDLSRKISFTDANLKQGIWNRHMGMLLYGKTIGIIGMGRIGKSLIKLLSSFNVSFKVCDPNPDFAFLKIYNVELTNKTKLLKESDVVSLNLPLKKDTMNFLMLDDLKNMKKSSILINTARGGIINEDDLYIALKENLIAGAAVDVFEEEPYKGKLRELNNVVLTCHMGASTIESRTDMETQAVEEVVRYKNHIPLKNEVFKNE